MEEQVLSARGDGGAHEHTFDEDTDVQRTSQLTSKGDTVTFWLFETAYPCLWKRGF